jgi:hypothetical protein
VSVYVFSSPPYDLKALPPVFSVKALLDLFRQNAVDRGLSVGVYDDLDQGDSSLQKLLGKDPEAPLPDGHRRVIEKEVCIEYSVPTQLQLKESQLVAISLMDELIFKLFSTHFLEPLVGFSTVTRVKGPPARRGKILVPRPTYDNIAKVPGFIELSPVIRYETIKLQEDLPAEALYNVAKTIDDLIYTLEQGSSKPLVKPVAPGPKNKVLQVKALQDQRDLFEQAQRERKRRLRKQVIEQRLKQEHHSKDVKVLEAIEEKKRLEEQDRVLKEKLEARRRKQQQDREKLLQEWRVKKQAEDKHKFEEDNKKLAEDFKRKQQLRDHFRQQASNKIKQLLEQQKEQRAEEQKAEAERAKQAEQQKEIARKVFLAKLNAARRHREQEQTMRAEEESQMNDSAVLAVCEEFRESVDVVFKHFCKASAATNVEVLNSSVLPLPGFSKFTNYFKIWPSLMSGDESTQIFHLLTKNKIPEFTVPTSLSRAEFNDALMRLALKGRQGLGLSPDSKLQEAVRKLLQFMHLTSDPRKTVDLLRRMASQQSQDPVKIVRRRSKTPIRLQSRATDNLGELMLEEVGKMV